MIEENGRSATKLTEPRPRTTIYTPMARSEPFEGSKLATATHTDHDRSPRKTRDV